MSESFPAQTEIDGRVCKTTLFSASKAFRIHYKFLGKIGRSVGTALGAVTGVLVNAAKEASDANKKKFDATEFLNVLGDSDLSLSFIGDAMAALYESMDEEEALAYIKEILATTAIDNVVVNEKNFETLFGSGNMIFLYKVVKFVLEANYPDFFDVFRKAKNDSKSENEAPVPTV